MTWTIESARACIERNGGKVTGKAIDMPLPGLRCLGAIDYLCKHGYRWVRGT